MTTNRPPTQRNGLQGSCTLVGAGPGDPELLTLRAVRAIESATVLLVDDLVSEAIVALAPRTARIVRVGKRGGCKSTPQAFIETLMLMAVHEGEHVVRLKGGDPFIFGRGGEEAEHMRAAGVAVEVVNGITAGMAGPTALGVPLTHRDHAQQARLTLVIYMGVSGARTIQDGLLLGLSADTPVAVVQHASLPQQRHATGRLEQLANTIAQHGLGSPSVIVVGEVVRGLAALHDQSTPILTRYQAV